MSEITTGEMVGWCNAMLLQLGSRSDDIRANGGTIHDLEEIDNHILILGAIRERLLQSIGQAEAAPAFDPAPDNVVQGNFHKKKDQP